MKRLLRTLSLCLICACVLFCSTEGTHEIVIREASGIAKVGDKLLIVGDDADGRYFELRVPDRTVDIIPIDPSRVKEVVLPGAELARDLESLDILGDGRLIFLSEQLRCLIARETPRDGRYVVVAEYDRTLSELGNRGLEGVAVKRLDNGDSRIAVLWEGGYPEHFAVPVQLREKVCGFPLKPVIVVHDIKNGEIVGRVNNPAARITLDAPEAEGKPPLAQRYRASDLVWHEKSSSGEDEFIVLMCSGDSPPDRSARPVRYENKVLQRFDLKGNSVGEPLDLKDVFSNALAGVDDQALAAMGEEMSSHVREVSRLLKKYEWENVNWEGLAWFADGEKLITIYDTVPKDPPLALIINIPQDWK